MTYEKQLQLLEWFYSLDNVIKPYTAFMDKLVDFARQVTDLEFDTSVEVECWIRQMKAKIR